MNNHVLKQNEHKHTETEKNLFAEYVTVFENSPLHTSQKLQSFAKYVRRQDISRFLAKNELFKMQLPVTGSIVECGSFMGQGLFTFAQLSAIYEPYNHTRRIIAFDTFEGFPSVSEFDSNTETKWKKGDLASAPEIVNELNQCISLFDKNRPVGHIPKIELVQGDVKDSIDGYIKQNPHLIVSMLYLDFDIYEPTLIAIKALLERMPKGAVLAFDELNAGNCPGETLALMHTMGIHKVELKRTPFDPYISYAIL